MENRQLISVIIGVYRRGMPIEPLKKSIQSLLNQTYSNVEIIICDDGSDSQTQTLLKQMEKEDHRIIIIREGRPSSLAHKLNYCLLMAKGDFIARQDDDDISVDTRFEKQIAFLAAHPHIAFVGSNAEVFDEHSTYEEQHFPSYPILQNFLFRQPYLHPSILFRRECLDAVDGYSETPHTELCEDYDLFMRLLNQGYCGANLQERLYYYRVSRRGSGRIMKHRWNECITRYNRFKELGLLPRYGFYVLKPILVGLVPVGILRWLREKSWKRR